jgi:hypothetical protein
VSVIIIFFLLSIFIFLMAIILLFSNYIVMCDEWKHLSPTEKGVGVASGIAAIFPRCRNPERQRRAANRSLLSLLLIVLSAICFFVYYYNKGVSL